MKTQAFAKTGAARGRPSRARVIVAGKIPTRKSHVRVTADIDEDAGTTRVINRSMAMLANGLDVLLPANVAEAIMEGESPMRAIRKWREMTQEELSKASQIKQSMISAMENGARDGTVASWRAVARVLRVPLDTVAPE